MPQYYYNDQTGFMKPLPHFIKLIKRGKRFMPDKMKDRFAVKGIMDYAGMHNGITEENYDKLLEACGEFGCGLEVVEAY